MHPFLAVLLAIDMSGAARDLARSAAAALSHEPASVVLRNRSALSPGEAAEIGRVFEAEVNGAGQPAAAIELTISENLTQYILVAEISRGGERQVLMESWPRAVGGPKDASPAVTLERKLLWEEDQPVLDALPWEGGVLVLDRERVLLAQGTARQTAALPAGRVWPRDARGRLSISGNAFTARLPGVACSGSLQPQLTVECRDSQEPWLIGPGVLAAFSPGANFFEGHLDVEPGGRRDVAPFYSAAPVDGQWILAGVDGRARIFTSTWEAAGEAGKWGSDVAGVRSPCGARLLATRAAAAGEADGIQPFELAGGTARPAGPALEFPGPITALWTAGGAATAVTHDLQTGRYAAYSLVPACGA